MLTGDPRHEPHDAIAPGRPARRRRAVGGFDLHADGRDTVAVPERAHDDLAPDRRRDGSDLQLLQAEGADDAHDERHAR